MGPAGDPTTAGDAPSAIVGVELLSLEGVSGNSDTSFSVALDLGSLYLDFELDAAGVSKLLSYKVPMLVKN
jgi:hypothetical protein